MTDTPSLLTVKVLARMPSAMTAKHFGRQLPSNSQWGKCLFVFDDQATDYDWLVVYHDIHSAHSNGQGAENLHCPRANTILVTTEPSTITVYGTDYLRQYGTVITSQEPWVIKHPNPIFTQPGLLWFYGIPCDGISIIPGAEDDKILTLKELQIATTPIKNHLISTICSIRHGRLTLHTRRVHFTKQLKRELPELEIFGHGVRPINDKADVLDPYFYHIAIENHAYPHHLTEKLPDAFLGYTLPFYHGCPNATDYFPPESFVPIDINDFKRTIDIIKSTIKNKEYHDRLPYIIRARNRVLNDYNFFSVIESFIRKNGKNSNQVQPENYTIMNRQKLRLRKPLIGILSLLEKFMVKSQHIIQGIAK